MKKQITAAMLLLGGTLFAQKTDTVYTVIPIDVMGTETSVKTTGSSFFFGNSIDHAVCEFTNVMREGLHNKKEQQRIENARLQSVAKLGLIKSQYVQYTKYPEKIIDGWHNVIATDNANFCKDVKVYVKDNRIKKFVIDNYVPVNFLATGEIKNAKNVLTLQNFNGEQLNVLEVYFIYDIEDQTIAPDPIQPGYICFWTPLNHYPDIQLKMDGQLMEPFTANFETMPACFSNGMVCRIMKPGTYSFKAAGKGTIDWDGSFEIKQGQCLRYKLGSWRK